MTEELFAGRYRIVETIGEGGMGLVLKAKDEILNTMVAIKTIKKGVLSDSDYVRFQREAKALAALNHQNLVPIYIFDMTADDGVPYIVMRLELGQPLSELIEQRGALELEVAISIFIQICDAMQHAHGNGVLHRDLKPGNIIVKEPDSVQPEIVVIDFGIAILENQNAIDSLTKTGLLIGSPAFMSPEQVNGHGADARSDIYSLGCIMFETLTGRQPFIAPTVLELLQQKVKQTAVSINAVRPGFPIALEAIVAKSLATLPDERYQSMAELKHELLSLDLEDNRADGVEDKDPAGGPPPYPIWKSRWLVAITAVSIIVAVGITVLMPFLANFLQPVFFHDSQDSSYDKNDEVELRRALGPDSKVFIEQTLITFEDSNDNSVKERLSKNWRAPLDTVCFLDSRVTGKCFDDCTLPIKKVIFEGSLSKLDVDGLKTVSRLPKLTFLSLINVEFDPQGLAFVLNKPTLTNVRIEGCSLVEKSVQALANSMITDLSLIKDTSSANSPLGDDAFKTMTAKCKAVRWLQWHDMPLSHEALSTVKKLPQLKFLSLSSMNLNDKDLMVIQGSNLEWLCITENNAVSAEGLKNVLQRNKKLKIIVCNSSHPSCTPESIRLLLLQYPRARISQRK